MNSAIHYSVSEEIDKLVTFWNRNQTEQKGYGMMHL